MKLDLLNRTITAAALVALAITLGVWLTHAPLTAAPAAEPVLAPPPVPVRPATTPTIIEVPVEVEIAAIADPSPAATPAEPKPEPKSASQPRRRGLFRRR